MIGAKAEPEPLGSETVAARLDDKAAGVGGEEETCSTLVLLKTKEINSEDSLEGLMLN